TWRAPACCRAWPSGATRPAPCSTRPPWSTEPAPGPCRGYPARLRTPAVPAMPAALPRRRGAVRIAGEDVGHRRIDPGAALLRRGTAAGMADRHAGPHQPVLARVDQVHVERAFGVAAHVGALAPVRHRHVGPRPVAVVVRVVHLGH